MISISILHLCDTIVSARVRLVIDLVANLFRPPDTDMAHKSLIKVISDEPSYHKSGRLTRNNSAPAGSPSLRGRSSKRL